MTAVTIGDGDATWALARGASRAISVGAYTPGKDNAVTASLLANAIKAAGEYDVILMGDAQEFAGVVPVTAAMLELPLVAGVSFVSLDPSDPTCLIAHRTTTQAQETLKIKTPALISVAAASSEKDFPGMRQIMAAKRLPVDKPDAEQLGNVLEDRLVVKELRLPEKHRVKLFEGEASRAVGELVNALRADGAL